MAKFGEGQAGGLEKKYSNEFLESVLVRREDERSPVKKGIHGLTCY